MPENCGTCRIIAANLGIWEREILGYTSSEEYDNQSTHDFSDTVEDTDTDFYVEEYIPDEYEEPTMEVEDNDDYTDRFALDEHEQQPPDEDEDYTEKWALDEDETYDTVTVDY